MRRYLLATLLGTALVLFGTEVRGEDPRAPSYLILQAPARTPHGQPYYPGRGYAVKPQAYAYGWFGVKSRSHWRRHEGYYSNYIQWSKQ
jgi:hypothetical protein